jgi:hypothetical protein
MSMVAKHEGEYWLTRAVGRPERSVLWTSKPWWDEQWVGEDPPTVIYGLTELCDPDKPVRIRLTMEAEVVDGD